MQTLIRGKKAVSGVEVDLKASEGGYQIAIPHTVAWTAKGYGRTAMATAAVAAVVVRPTTTAMVSLYNIGATNLVIERAFAHELVSAAVTTASLWLCVHPTGTIVAGYANDITARGGLNGSATTDADAFFDIEDTVTAGDWVPWSENYGYVLTVTTPSVVLVANVNGRIIIPPTAGISLQVVASVNTATFCAGFHWFSVPTSELALG